MIDRQLLLEDIETFPENERGFYVEIPLQSVDFTEDFTVSWILGAVDV